MNRELEMVVANVLILVLMEDTHWEVGHIGQQGEHLVLILVLMEDTHWVFRNNV